jgi:hypothetical protein
MLASYFLISYPHTEHNGDYGNELAPDYWVIKFYKDLCRNVEELVEAAPGTRVGVLDRDLSCSSSIRGPSPAPTSTVWSRSSTWPKSPGFRW